MSDERMIASEIVSHALDELAIKLADAGIPADVICPTVLGWSIAASANVSDPSDLAKALRQSADNVDGFAMPVAGHA